MKALLASLVLLGMIILLVGVYRMDNRRRPGKGLELPKKKR